MKTPPKNVKTMSREEFRKELFRIALEDQARLARAAENERLAIIAEKYGKPQTEKK